MNIGFSATNVTCFGASDGAIALNVSGGTLPYTYSWSNGASTRNLNNLSGGTYRVIVTDAMGCTLSQNVTVGEPAAALSLSAVVSDELCFGDGQGAIDLSVTGGTGPYVYSWNNGSSTQDIVGLESGDYQVTVTDKNGCMVSAVYTVGSPDQLAISASVSPISCRGEGDGAVDVTVSGGVAPYTYAWNHGATTEDISGLAPGTYQLTITDANGCTSSASWQLTEPLPLTINQVTSHVSCFGANDGGVSLSVSGGTLPYSYSWNNGATTRDISNLAGGTYEVTVTDARGCEQQLQVVVQAPSAELSATALHYRCIL